MMYSFPFRLSLPGLLLTLLATTPTTAADTPDPAAVLAAIQAAELDVARPLAVADLRLNAGFAVLSLERGTFFPVRTADGAVVELLFLGDGRVEMTPPDDVEAGQLELFTGSTALDERFTEAVFVVARDAASAALLGRATAAEVDAATAERARARFTDWRASWERRLLDVEGARLLDALGDPFFESYFAAWFLGAERGEFLLLVDPDAPEQISLGQFLPLELSDLERRKLERELRREKRSGRLTDLAVGDLGWWNSWLSTPLRTAGGEVRPGHPGFEPERYTLDVTVDPRQGEVRGNARLTLRAVTGARRAVRLALHPDLAVTSVRSNGGELFFRRDADEILALLPEAPAPGAAVEVEVAYGGQHVQEGGARNWALADALSWYPHAGEVDRARYDVTLRWPRKLDLVASGRRVDGGVDGDLAWERRQVDLPTIGFSFEIGRFKVQQAQAGHVALTVAFDPEVRELSAGTLDEITATLADALVYYEEVFGPYPLDELTVVTVPRFYSQAMLGFITLSNVMMADLGDWGILLGFEDRRSVLAHELAHQWWGNLVGWQSYRDQWISEAMANYAALLWARHRLPPEEWPVISPTSGWEEALTTELADGRPLESIGPLVLGRRLASSRAPDAYQAIVYRKGAVVLDTLARSFGEETFTKVLGNVSRAAAGRVISTADLMALIGRATGRDLTDFSRRFVTGTGLPEVYYSTSATPAADGKWRLAIHAEQETPYRFRYATVKGADGRLDVARTGVEQTAVDGSQLIVPFQVLMVEKGRKRGKSLSADQQLLVGHMAIAGAASDHTVDLDGEPERIWLDYRGQVFARFFDVDRQPKQQRLREGRRLSAAGRTAEAEAALRAALVTELPDDGELTGGQRRDFSRALDARAHLELARVLIATGRDAEARSTLVSARAAAPRAIEWWLDPQADLVEARLDLRAGDAERAFKSLHKLVLKRRQADDAESYLLLAIAAQQTGHTAERDQALERARELGADVAALTQG